MEKGLKKEEAESKSVSLLKEILFALYVVSVLFALLSECIQRRETHKILETVHSRHTGNEAGSDDAAGNACTPPYACKHALRKKRSRLTPRLLLQLPPRPQD
jgi:hypothetical protein